MAGEIYFKSGSKSSITTQAPLTPSYKAGTVYFAVDNTDNGFIYLDYNNKRIPMTAVASKDSANNSIISTYMASVSFDSNSSSLIFKDGNNDTHSTVLLPFLLLTGGNVTGPVNFGDSVTIDELTAGSLIVNGVARFNNGLIGNLTGNADTATSAISATKDSSNHKIVDYYVHSIAHSNNTINYSNGNGDSLGSFKIPGAFFVKGTQTSSTNAWTGALPSGVTQYYEGLSIAYFLPYEGTSTAATLNLGGLGAKPIIIGENATSAATTHYAAKNVIWMTYLTDSSINSGNGYWKVSAHRNSTYYYTTAYCTTGAGTAAKAGNVSYYTLQPGYIPVMFSYDNTAQSALTLNINSTGAKPLYINGVASSSSNYTIPKDVYMVYYDGTNYYLRTDGVLPGKMERAVADGGGNNIQSTYANSLTLSGSTLTLKNKNGDKLSEVTIAASDTKVNVTLGTTTKAYILGTSTTPTGTATGVTSIADTGVYLGTTAGELVATKFTGDLAGNATSATSATSATNDSANHKITDHYVHSITTSSNTLTYKDGDGDQLGTASLVNSVSNTWAAGTTNGPTIKTTVNGVDGTAVAIPSASASASGIVTTGAQTFAGSKTFNSKIIGNLQGNADSATKATNDGGGNEIESTYIKAISYSGNSSTNAAGSSITAGSAGLVTMTKGDDTTSKIDIPAATASIAGLVNNGAQTFAGTKTFSTGVTIASGTSTKAVFNYSDIQAGTSDAARPVWFAWAGQNGTPVIDTDFTYNPSTNTLKATNFDGLAAKATADSNGNNILSTYANSLTLSGSTLTLKNKNGDKLSEVTIAASDTKVNVTLGTTSKAYILGTTTTPTGTATGVTSIADTGVYLGTTAGELVATKFTGALNGNATSATSATSATNDSANHKIVDHYVHSITTSSNTLTYKDGDGDQLGTATIINSVSNSWTAGTTAGPSLTTTVNGKAGTAVAIPSASASASGVVTTGAQTFAGSKTFNSKIIGNLQGNADTATSATNDSGSHKIIDYYIHSITFDSSTSKLTYKTGNDDPTDILLPFLLLTGGNVTGPVSFGDSVSIDALTVGSLVSTGVATFNNGLIGNLTGNADTATKATQDSNGNNILNHYAHSLTSATNTLTLKNANGDTLSTANIVNSISNSWTDGTSAGPKIQITVNGQSSTAAAIPSASSSISGVVTTGAQTFAGSKTFSSKIIGDLQGNADTATKATGDSSGNNILNFYAHSLTSSGNTLTLKNGNGDSLSTPSIVNSISNTWTDGTSAGPTLKTTVNGIAGTAVAIPSASSSVSGVVTTGAQTFAGVKTMSAALNLANNTANKIGDDVSLGDFNVAGTLGIQGLNGTTGIALIKQSESWATSANLAKISYDGSNVSITKPVKGFVTAAYYGGQSNSTKIKIQINSTTSWMLSFVVTLYQSYRATKIMISGYNYGTNHWYQPEARLIADSDGTETIATYFGYDSDWNLWIGFDGGNYTGVSITDVVNGYTQIADYSNLFTITNVSDLGGTTQATITAASKADYANTAGEADHATTASGVKDYNNGTVTTFGYSTSGMDSTSWLGSWDGYKLRAISPANALKSAVGTTAIGGTAKPIYWTGSAFAALSASAGSTYVPAYLNAGTLTACTSPSILVNLESTSAANVFTASPRPGVTGVLGVANGGTGRSSWTANQLVYSSGTTTLINTSGLSYFSGNSTAATPATYTRLHINGATYGNTAANMISGTAGLFSFGDGGPQITFDTSATPGGGQAGALIFTDNDTAGTGASWHFVSNQSDWTVTSKRFHARTSISIGTDLPVTSDTLYINGTTLTTDNISRTAASLGTSWIGSRDKAVINVDASDSTSSTAFSLARIKFSTKTYAIGSERAGNAFGIYGWNNSKTENGTDWAFYIGNDTYFRCTTRLYGAVWNDYAEYRISKEKEPGRCVREVGDDTLVLTTERLQLGCEIVSDTFGFAIGQTEKADTPIASNGRVLAYPFEDREEFKNHIGEPVCSGPNGTISIMTKEEIKEYPHCIIGTISAVPDYEEWGTENIKVNGRIWIRIR